MSNLEKKKLTAEEKESIISDWKQSGLSKKEFAEQRGLKYCTFVGCQITPNSNFEKKINRIIDPGHFRIITDILT